MDGNKILERIQIPKVHWGARLDRVNSEFEHKTHIQTYIEGLENNIQKGRGLLLWGEYSHGKSALASIILKAAVNQGYIGFWIRGKHIARYMIEDTIFDDDYTVYERALTVPLLVIDELIVGSSPKAEAFIDELIRERVDGVKATILTSNLDPITLKKSHPALAAVLKEAVLPLEIKGYDYRSEISEEIESDLG